MDGKIYAEWMPLKKVFVYRPGIEMFFGLLNPAGSLYERSFSRVQAHKEHDILTNTLKKERLMKYHWEEKNSSVNFSNF